MSHLILSLLIKYVCIWEKLAHWFRYKRDECAMNVRWMCEGCKLIEWTHLDSHVYNTVSPSRCGFSGYLERKWATVSSRTEGCSCEQKAWYSRTNSSLSLYPCYIRPSYFSSAWQLRLKIRANEMKFGWTMFSDCKLLHCHCYSCAKPSAPILRSASESI